MYYLLKILYVPKFLKLPLLLVAILLKFHHIPVLFFDPYKDLHILSPFYFKWRKNGSN